MIQTLPERMASSEHRLPAAVEVTSRHWRPQPATDPDYLPRTGWGAAIEQRPSGITATQKTGQRRLGHRLGRADHLVSQASRSGRLCQPPAARPAAAPARILHAPPRPPPPPAPPRRWPPLVGGAAWFQVQLVRGLGRASQSTSAGVTGVCALYVTERLVCVCVCV